jgi:hypothetical protein
MIKNFDNTLLLSDFIQVKSPAIFKNEITKKPITKMVKSVNNKYKRNNHLLKFLVAFPVDPNPSEQQSSLQENSNN